MTRVSPRFFSLSPLPAPRAEELLLTAVLFAAAPLLLLAEDAREVLPVFFFAVVLCLPVWLLLPVFFLVPEEDVPLFFFVVATFYPFRKRPVSLQQNSL